MRRINRRPAQIRARGICARLQLLRHIPIKLMDVCEYYGIEVYESPAIRYDAMYIAPLRGANYIMVNSRINRGRWRFSVAHELGHNELGHGAIEFCEAKDGKHIDRPHWQERLADVFAAELLMPVIAVKRDAHRYTLRELVRRYEVSYQAMEYRLNELGLQCGGWR